jgi:tRNA-binding protein
LNNLFKSFKDLDIRVGTIIHVERFEEAIKPSYKLKIDFGELGVFKIFDTDNKKLYT